jgi:Fe(3+) dicitrate transport protein
MSRKSSFILLIISVLYSIETFAQTINLDSLSESVLSEITIVGAKSRADIQQIPEIVGTNIYAGKKNALVVMENVQGNIASNTMRQVLAKVPGIHIWESDGSGIQIGIAARGLSPNRSWEFNIRQNGYDIAADPYGYPEAYYNPQLQSVQRIEIVRGHGALQYGAQIGGMVNYLLKNGSDINKKFQVESSQTVGTNGLFNSYNAIGGKTKKWHYYTFFDHRNADGWRENSVYKNNSGFASLSYLPNLKMSITFEAMRWNMLSQQSGGLTDAQFQQNAQQSFRSRNWFELTWTTGAAILNYKINASNTLNVKVFGMEGDRNSVGFLPSNGILTKDTINKATLKFNPRTVDKDVYQNYGLEARFLTNYRFFEQKNAFSAGIRAYRGNTHRLKTGKGTEGSTYDVSVLSDAWVGDIDYATQNAAIFAENIFHIGKRFIIIPGARLEYLKGEASGYSGLNNGQPIVLQNQVKSRFFAIAAVGAEFHTNETDEFYGNVAQSYRPIQFADLTAPPTTDVIDANLKDARGLNIDLGYRGKRADFLFFDASVYYLLYQNRIGTLKQAHLDGSFYNLRTNIGSSNSKGIEAIIEWNPIKTWIEKPTLGDVSLFVSYSYNDSKYADLQVVNVENGKLVAKNFNNNRVENAPLNILRSGLNYHYRKLLLTTQYSYTSAMFTDANNTSTPTANGQNGLIPAYNVWDFTATYRLNEQFSIKAGVNNLTDERYFTRRAGGYPGPGLLPADGRSFWLSLNVKL